MNFCIPIKINVFDTPGFADSNVEQIRQNKLLIASSLRKDIHAVIFLTANDRFEATSQTTFETLNEWTNGQIWNNLIYIKGRTLFDEQSVSNRIANNGLLLLLLLLSDIWAFYLMKKNHIKIVFDNRHLLSNSFFLTRETLDFDQLIRMPYLLI